MQKSCRDDGNHTRASIENKCGGIMPVSIYISLPHFRARSMFLDKIGCTPISMKLIAGDDCDCVEMISKARVWHDDTSSGGPNACAPLARRLPSTNYAKCLHYMLSFSNRMSYRSFDIRGGQVQSTATSTLTLLVLLLCNSVPETHELPFSRKNYLVTDEDRGHCQGSHPLTGITRPIWDAGDERSETRREHAFN
jgi:hypothetical protein